MLLQQRLSTDFLTYTWSFYPASPTCRIRGIRCLRDTCLHMCRWMDPRNSTTVDYPLPEQQKKVYAAGSERVGVCVQARIECQPIENRVGWKDERKRRFRVEQHTQIKKQGGTTILLSTLFCFFFFSQPFTLFFPVENRLEFWPALAGA